MKQLLLNDFRFRRRFSSALTDDILQDALEVVNAEFSGVYQLWALLPHHEREDKIELCVSYLVAWYLTDNYPDLATGVVGTGGMPIKSKRAGPVSITFKDTVRDSQSVLAMLTTNVFGQHALTLIQTAPEMYQLYL